jgi:hypothetical protein
VDPYLRIGSGFSRVPGFGFTIQIRIQEGINYQEKLKKVNKFIFGSAGCSFLRAEDFSSSLDVL